MSTTSLTAWADRVHAGERDCSPGLVWRNVGPHEPPNSQELTNEKLSAELQAGKTRFSARERDTLELNLDELSGSHIIKSGESYFTPERFSKLAQIYRSEEYSRKVKGGPSLKGVMKSLLRNEWMTVGMDVPTTDMKTVLSEQMATIGVICALFFTMVSLGSEDMGDELEAWPGISQSATRQMFVTLSLFAQAMLLIGTMHSVSVWIVIMQLNSPDEVALWHREMGHKFDVPVVFMILGLILYVLSQVWMGASNLEAVWFFTYLGIFLFFVFFIVVQLVLTVKALYLAKYKVAEGMTVDVHAEGGE